VFFKKPINRLYPTTSALTRAASFLFTFLVFTGLPFEVKNSGRMNIHYIDEGFSKNGKIARERLLTFYAYPQNVIKIG